MAKKSGYLFKISATVLTVIMLISLFSCTGTRKRQALESFADVLRTDYESSITYSINGGDTEISGNAEIRREGTVTSLDILAPEPYSGMSIRYDVKGLPQSVAVHFSGMDTRLPTDAVSRINAIAVIFADDFASNLSKLSAEGLTEYEIPDSDGKTAYKADVKHGEADITVYFDRDGIPLSLEYRSEAVNADVTFDSFLPYTITKEQQ